MLDAAEFFVDGQQIVRLNEKIIGEVSREYGINTTELCILIFLANNPQYDTAREIVEYRMLTKSRVSKAVDSLVRQGYLTTREDETDRRIIHLVLEEKANTVIDLGLQAQRYMINMICRGISEDDMESYCRIHDRMIENTREALKLCGKN